MLIILLVVFALALAGGGYGHSRVGYIGWSPAAVILAIVVVLYFTGNLHLHAGV
jgi:hypothetical protein